MPTLEISPELKRAQELPITRNSEPQRLPPLQSLFKAPSGKLPSLYSHEPEPASDILLQGYLTNNAFTVYVHLNGVPAFPADLNHKILLLQSVSFDYICQIKDIDRHAYATWKSHLTYYLRWVDAQPEGPIEESSKMMSAVVSCRELCPDYATGGEVLPEGIGMHDMTRGSCAANDRGLCEGGEGENSKAAFLGNCERVEHAKAEKPMEEELEVMSVSEEGKRKGSLGSRLSSWYVEP